MYINLRMDIIERLKSFIGEELPEICFRSGRIEYEQWQNNENFFSVEFDEEDIQFQIEYNYRMDRYETIKKYSDVKNYEEWKNNGINDYKKKEEQDIRNDIHIIQHFWTTDDKIIATSICFYSKVNIRTFLANAFFITDEFGEPSFEDTKLIEWNLINNQKIIIVLPKKASKNEEHFSIIFGEKDFFDKTEIWKTNL